MLNLKAMASNVCWWARGSPPLAQEKMRWWRGWRRSRSRSRSRSSLICVDRLHYHRRRWRRRWRGWRWWRCLRSRRRWRSSGLTVSECNLLNNEPASCKTTVFICAGITQVCFHKEYINIYLYIQSHREISWCISMVEMNINDFIKKYSKEICSTLSGLGVLLIVQISPPVLHELR